MNTAQKKRILVIDDTPAHLKVIIDLLKSDYAIVFAKDGRTGIDLALSKKPDLILLDVMMPGMNGFEVIGILKANAETVDIPVLFLTAKSEAEDEAMGISLGAGGYVTKPIDPEVLRASVGKALKS